jgi:hypothetical protein
MYRLVRDQVYQQQVGTRGNRWDTRAHFFRSIPSFTGRAGQGSVMGDVVARGKSASGKAAAVHGSADFAKTKGFERFLTVMARRNPTACAANAIGRATTMRGTQKSLGNARMGRVMLAAGPATRTSTTNLIVSEPEDPLEREAEGIARAVAGTSPQGASGRTLDGGEWSTVVGWTAQPGVGTGDDHRAQVAVPRSGTGGEPLPESARSYFGPRLGADLRGVRIHADRDSDESTRSINALAYTVGKDIYFADGQYDPSSSTGRRLLAHELVHAVHHSGRPENGVARQANTDGADGGALTVSTDAGVGGAGAAGIAMIEDYTIPTDPDAQRRQLQQAVVEKGRHGPRDYLDGFEMAVLRATPAAGMAENQSQLEGAQAALETLRGVVEGIEWDIESQLAWFTTDGRVVLDDMLKDSETRAKAEGIKYGLTEEIIEELVLVDPMSGMTDTQTWTKYGMPESPAARGMAAAAAQLLKRRNERITPLKSKLRELNTRWGSAFAPSGGPFWPPKPPGLEETEANLKEEEQEYDGLAAELAGRYPIIGSFTKDKDDTSGLRRLAAGPSQEAAQLIGTQIAETLRNIKRVRDENTPDGEVNIYKLGKIVALTKARQSIADGSWQEKVIDEQVADAQETSILIDIALALLNLALVALAPATGGASLIVAAGLSTATAVIHAQEYMLEDAMAGSDVDKARALSQEDPSLFWLAVDIVGAVGDVGAGASAAAKLLRVWHSAAPAVRAVKAAGTAEEVAAARGQLKAALEGQPELFARVAKSLDEEGRLTKISKEIEAVERAADVAQAELKTGREAATAAGHVNVTPSGRVFSCTSPCTEIRARYSEVLASDEGKNMFATLKGIEDDAAKLAPGDDLGLEAVAKRAAALDDELAKVAIRARAQKIAAWLPTMAEAFPALKDNPLSVDAVIRIIKKTNSDHIKGQLLEELAGAKVEKMIAAGEKAGLEKLAGERAGAALEYIGGHRIKDARGKQFTDGMLIIRDGDAIEIVAIFESKAGKSASRGLGAEYSSLKPDGSYKSLKELGAGRPIEELTDGELALIEARRKAIQDLRGSSPKKYRKLKIEQIDEAADAQGDIARVMDKMVKTEAGQAVQDIERAVSVGLTIDDAAVKVAKAGRKSTKVVGVLPTDVNAAAIEAKIAGAPDLSKPGVKAHRKPQGVKFGTMDVGMTSKDLSELASEIAARSAAPTL